MTTIDDILYAPIMPAHTIIDSALVAQAAVCIGDPNNSMSFSVDPVVGLATYLRIAEIISNDRIIRRTAESFCPVNNGNLRPVGALTIQQIFECFCQQPKKSSIKTYWTSTGTQTSLGLVHFGNLFSITAGLPSIRIMDGWGGVDHEWWAVGLMPDFLGQSGYYAFINEQDAERYWKS